MMCLGITSDSQFIKRVLCSANAKKFPICVLGVDYSDKTVSCKEFLRIFRQDLIQEKVTEAVRNKCEGKKPHGVNVQQMLDVVKDTWYELAGGDDPPSINIKTIAHFLSDVWKVSDRSYALKYIHHCV